jgi:hypothetical protein
MLAALIGSQSLVALVSAAPTPNPYFDVKLKQNFVKQHEGNQALQKGRCLIATDPKNACTDALTDKMLTDALDFLAEHKSCEALTTKDTVKFNWGESEFDKFPMEAMCYWIAKECGKLTKANFPNYKDITLAKSICSEASKPSKPAAKAKVYEEEEGDYIPRKLTPFQCLPLLSQRLLIVLSRLGRVAAGALESSMTLEPINYSKCKTNKKFNQTHPNSNIKIIYLKC